MYFNKMKKSKTKKKYAKGLSLHPMKWHEALSAVLKAGKPEKKKVAVAK